MVEAEREYRESALSNTCVACSHIYIKRASLRREGTCTCDARDATSGWFLPEIYIVGSLSLKRDGVLIYMPLPSLGKRAVP